MKLIFLHGPPASGKFTIAKELEGLIGCHTFHNHLTIDAAKPFFEFGTENFWKLVRELRLTCLRVAATHTARTIVFTSCYDHPYDLGFFEELEQTLLSARGVLIPVYLQCSIAELEKRVSNTSRVEMGKTRTINALHKNLKDWNCVAVPRANCLTVVTEHKTPSQCAKEIVDILKLSR